MSRRSALPLLIAGMIPYPVLIESGPDRRQGLRLQTGKPRGCGKERLNAPDTRDVASHGDPSRVPSSELTRVYSRGKSPCSRFATIARPCANRLSEPFVRAYHLGPDR